MAKFCANCGSPLQDGALFCENCGTPVQQAQAAAPVCARCGAELKIGAKFCPVCGAPVNQEQPTPAQPTQAQQVRQEAPAPVPVQPAPVQPQAPQPVQAPAPVPVQIPQQAPVQQPMQRPVQQPIQQPVQQQPGQPQPVQPRVAQPQQWQEGRGVAVPANTFQPRQKKNSPALKIISIILAVTLVIQLAIAGFVRPGWFRGSRAAALNYRMDGRVMELSIPALSKAQTEVYQAGNSATQSYYTARLWLERLTAAAEAGKSGAEMESLVDQTVEAWRAAYKICEGAQRMARALEQMEDSAKAKAGSILSYFDLTLHADAAESIDPELLKWAQEITEMYDKAPAGRQVRTLAEQLGMDAKHAFEVIKQSQAIMKGKYEGDADVANYWYETCMKTKTACKAIVVTTAIVSSGGAAGTVGLVDGALLTASGIDAIVEVGDTTVNIVAGEGSQVQAEYSKMKDKIAPVTGVAGAVGLFAGGWSTAVDKAGQFIYISDSIHDLVENGKIAGIQLPGTGPAPEQTQEQGVKMVKLPLNDGQVSPEEVRESLEKLGVPPETAEQIAEAVKEQAENTPADQPEEAPPAGAESSFGDVTDLDELSDEELDQLLEEMLEMEELEENFDELFESFDEDIPVEDLPQPGDDEGFEESEAPGEDWGDEGEPAQPGDDEGFDNPENWAKPENPDDLGEPAQPGDDEGFDNPENWAKPENPGSFYPSASELAGTYQGTKTEWSVIGGELANEHVYDDRKIEFIYEDGQLYYGSGKTIPLRYDSASGKAYGELSDTTYEFEFEVVNDNIHVKETRLYYYNSSDPTGKTVFEGVLQDDLSKFAGTYTNAGGSLVTASLFNKELVEADDSYTVTFTAAGSNTLLLSAGDAGDLEGTYDPATGVVKWEAEDDKTTLSATATFTETDGVISVHFVMKMDGEVWVDFYGKK